MELKYVYTKPRKLFGRQCRFSDLPPKLLISIDPDPSLTENFILRNPIHKGIQISPTISLHEINTDNRPCVKRGLNHEEGGWAKDVDVQNEYQKYRFRKTIRKDEAYSNSVMHLSQAVAHCVRQNNAINIFNNYFDDVPVVSDGPAQTRVVVSFKSKTDESAVAFVTWSPESNEKLVSVHCNLHTINFEWGPPSDSYVWNTKYIVPEMTLKPPSSAVCAQFNIRDTHTILGALCSGQVLGWDTRKNEHPAFCSILGCSHKGIAWSVKWLMSKTGTEFVSLGSDGKALIWDIRKLQAPLETFIVDPTKKMDLDNAESLCACDYRSDSSTPMKFLAGTDRGKIFLCNRKTKEPKDFVQTVYTDDKTEIISVQRNPFYSKCFLSVDRYTVSIWMEEMDHSPVFSTPYHNVSLTGGCWSLIRPHVFLTSKADGTIDVWDLCYRQHGPTFSTKLSADALNCICMADSGHFFAAGSDGGVINVSKVSEGFYLAPPNEKNHFINFIERELRKEKVLDSTLKGIQTAKKQAAEEMRHAPSSSKTSRSGLPKGLLDECEKSFFNYLDKVKVEYEKERINRKERQEKLRREILRKKLESGRETDSSNSSRMEISSKDKDKKGSNNNAFESDDNAVCEITDESRNNSNLFPLQYTPRNLLYKVVNNDAIESPSHQNSTSSSPCEDESYSAAQIFRQEELVQKLKKLLSVIEAQEDSSDKQVNLQLTIEKKDNDEDKKG